MRRTVVFSLIALAVVIVCAVLVYNARWIEQERRIPPGADAQRNQYLAAERFLAELGIPAESLDGYGLLEALPDPGNAIVLGGSRLGLSERRVDALTDWVDRGGLLILQANEEIDSETGLSGDLLLDRLGIALHRPLDDAVEDIVPDAVADLIANRLESDSDDCDAGLGMTEVSLDGDPDPAFVNFPAWRSIDYYGDDPARSAGNEMGTQLLYLPQGDGAVVAMTDLSIWRNQHIGCFDHAHVLRHLSDGRAKVSWLYNVNMPPLPLLILQTAPWTVALLSVALLIWLWRGFVRTRRPRLSADSARREVMEHVDARARFAWQHGRRDGLLAALRAEVAGSRINATELSELAAAAGVSEDAARAALSNSAPRRQDHFANEVRILQRLRKAKTSDNTPQP